MAVSKNNPPLQLKEEIEKALRQLFSEMDKGDFDTGLERAKSNHPRGSYLRPEAIVIKIGNEIAPDSGHDIDPTKRCFIASESPEGANADARSTAKNFFKTLGSMVKAHSSGIKTLKYHDGMPTYSQHFSASTWEDMVLGLNAVLPENCQIDATKALGKTR